VDAARRLSQEIRLARHVQSYNNCVYLYVRGGTRTTIQNNTLAKLQWRRNHVLGPYDENVRINLVTSTYTMPCNELLKDNIRHIHTIRLLTN
jgi:hypothetical protein